MPNEQQTLNWNNKPYFDDFKQEKGFHKILFKSGYSVQTRELNQMQEILQQQIKQLGTHLFKNGAIVVPGGNKLNKKARYVLIQNKDVSTTNIQLCEDLKGKVIKQDVGDNALEANCLYAETSGDLILAILSYKNSSTQTIDGKTSNITDFQSNTPLTIVDQEGQTITSNLIVAEKGQDNEPPTGNAIYLTTDAGVFYCDGYFVYTPSQSVLVAWNYGKRDLNCKVGFIVKKDIVTCYDDESLYDNAYNTPNYNAPGADRFEITLTLAKVGLDVEDNFLELIRYENSWLKVNSTNTSYNVLEDTLARRTYDESGDYVVSGLQAKVREHLKTEDIPSGYYTKEEGGSDNKFLVEISSGKAYVKGYEVENHETLYLEVDKARTKDCTRFENDVLQSVGNGNYIYLAPGNRFFDISKHPVIWLTNGYESTSDIIGYAIPKYMDAVSISGHVVFKLFGSFFLNETGKYGWQHLGGWKIDTEINGPVLQRVWLEKVVGSYQVDDGNPLTSHTGFTPYAWDNANNILYLKKNQNSPVFDSNISVKKGAAEGYPTKLDYLHSLPKGGGDIVELITPNMKTTKDPLGQVELQTDMGFNVEIITDANGYGVYDLVGDGIFVGDPVCSSTRKDNSYFNNIVNIENEGKRLVINNVKFPNDKFSVTAQLNKNLSLKTKSLMDGETLITKPSQRVIVLKHKDIYKLEHVYLSVDKDTAPDPKTDEDVKDFFKLVNRDTIDTYENTGLQAVSGYNPGDKQLLVQYKYFAHTEGDVFSVDSYSALKDDPANVDDVTHIGRIPEFKTKEKTYYLNDYLDFRQAFIEGFFIIKGKVTQDSTDILVEEDYSNVISIGSTIYANGFIPDRQTTPDAPYATIVGVDSTKLAADTPSTYSGSVYLIVAEAGNDIKNYPFGENGKNTWGAIGGSALYYDATFFVERRDIAVVYKEREFEYIKGTPGNSQYPDVPENALCLSRFIVAPYTRSASDVSYNNVDNKRYTMRDIGKLETRIENLEYYTSLTLKEIETAEYKITDADGLDRYKCGFFVSSFKNFDNFNPFDGTFRATIVEEAKRKVIPYQTESSVAMLFDQQTSSNFVIKNDKILLPYTHKVEIEQPYATKSESVNPYLIISWYPQMEIKPTKDVWHETEWEGSVTNIVNVTRNARTIYKVDFASDIRRNLESWRNFLNSVSTNVKDYGMQLTAEYVSSTWTTQEVSNSNVKLGESFVPYMRTKDITFEMKGAKPNTKYYPIFDGKNVEPFCTTIDGNGVYSGWGIDLISNSMGYLKGVFRIPAGTFPCGTKTFILADADVSISEDIGVECQASADYTAQGKVIHMQNVTTITNTTWVQKTVQHVIYYNPDPLAQTFFTSDVQGDGFFTTKIGLYFRKRDTTQPVFVELREVVNGYPVETRIEGSLVQKQPDDVITSEDSSVETEFEFESPIWLERDKQYAIVVWAETSRYHVFISELGEKVLNMEAIVGEQPSLGSLFKSQNASTWTPHQYQDLKFRVYRAEFQSGMEGVWNFKNTGNARNVKSYVSTFTTTNGSNEIVVSCLNHGLRVNDKVTITTETSPTLESNSPLDNDKFNGIPFSNIRGERVVGRVIDINRFVISATSNALKTGLIELPSKYIYISASSNFYKYTPVFETLVQPNTKLQFLSNLTTGKDYDGAQTIKATMPERIIQNGKEIKVDEVGLVQSPENELAGSSINIKVKSTTSSNMVSPIVSLNNNNVLVSSLALNKPTDLIEQNADETKNNGNSKLITQIIRLTDPANSLRIFTTENKLAADDIRVFYRVASSNDIEEVDWAELQAKATVTQADTETYIEHERAIDNLPEFTTYQVKIVLLGNNSCRHPSINELRVIAVA